MMELYENKNGYHFHCIPFGTVNISEMVVTQTIIDNETGKKYLLFKSAHNGKNLYIREFFGKIEDEQYVRIRNHETVKRIAIFLKNCGIEILESSL